MYEENNFTAIFKNLARFKNIHLARPENNFILVHQNNCVECSIIIAKSFNILAIGLNVQYNFFNDLT